MIMDGISAMLRNVYWIGIKESEILELEGKIAGSVTIFGSGKQTNRAYDKACGVRYDYNRDIPGYVDFLRRELNTILAENPDAKFLFYDNQDLYCDLAEMTGHAIENADKNLLSRLNDKWYVKDYLYETVDLLPYHYVSGKEILSQYGDRLANGERLVIQGNNSSGGEKTFLLDKSGMESLIPILQENEKYCITSYQENNVSVNVHVIIFDDNVLITPLSIQLLNCEDGRFLYAGGDFAAVKILSHQLKRKIKENAFKVGEKLQKSGYRGVCGIDFLIVEENVYFMEINARFQSSTFLINRALKDYHYQTLQELHIAACTHKQSPKGLREVLENLQINYSFYQYLKQKQKKDLLYFTYLTAKNSPEVTAVLDDDLDWRQNSQEQTYLYRIVFHTNIADIGPVGKVRIHPAINLKIEEPEIEYTEKALIRLKILLFNHGITIGDEAEQFLSEHGGIKFEEFNALNATIYGHIRMNIPYHARFTSLSPFSVQLSENETYLCYLDKVLCKIEVAPADPNYYRTTCKGTNFSDICYMNFDRLRINFHSGCYFKYLNKGCKFCDVEEGNLYNQFEDLKEAIDLYGEKEELRHFLIGGGSGIRDKDFSYAMKITKYIQKTVKKPVYIMTTPPKNLDILDQMKECGVTEVAFNIEFFDRKLAEELMPGKGIISLEDYAKAFERAVKLWGNTGQVRSALIVGLESSKTFLQGVEWLCRQGVSPMLSPFRPYYHTDFENRLPAEDEEILRLYYEAKKICDTYGMILGPSCADCEDNTIKVTL